MIIRFLILIFFATSTVVQAHCLSVSEIESMKFLQEKEVFYAESISGHRFFVHFEQDMSNFRLEDMSANIIPTCGKFFDSEAPLKLCKSGEGYELKVQALDVSSEQIVWEDDISVNYPACSKE